MRPSRKHNCLPIATPSLSLVKNFSPYPLLDSYGKIESDVLDGNLIWIGDFDECRSVYAPPDEDKINGDFHGKYCLISYSPYGPDISLNRFSIGICIPDSCELSDITNVEIGILNFTKKIPILDQIDVKNIDVDCQPNSNPYELPAIIVASVIAILIVVCCIGTVMELECFSISKRFFVCSDILTDSDAEGDYIQLNKLDTMNNNKNSAVTEGPKVTGLNVVKEIFSCFGILSNLKRVFNTENAGEFLFIFGGKFLFMIWIIFCHVIAFSLMNVRSPKAAVPSVDSWGFQIFLNGFFSVELFFVVSGFLTAFNWLDSASSKKTGEATSLKSWIVFWLHRIVRIVPAYAMLLAVQTYIFPYIGTGPLWTSDTWSNTVDPVCRDNWWRNLLFINNFGDIHQQCMSWTWYLACDMQFYMFSPVILWILHKFPKKGYYFLFLGLIACAGVNFGLTWKYDLYAGVGDLGKLAEDPLTFMTRFAEYFQTIYTKPYTRCGAYLVGIMLGFHQFKKQEKASKSKKLSTRTLLVGWVSFLSLGFWVLFGLYHTNPTTGFNSCYNAVSHILFAFCLAWVFFVCLNDQGGFINTFLSSKIFIPLNRLGYCGYLIHPMTLNWYLLSMKTRTAFNIPSLLMIFLGTVVMTYVFALFLVLLVEIPSIRLEKLFRTKIEANRKKSTLHES